MNEQAFLTKIYNLCLQIGDLATISTIKTLVLGELDEIDERIAYYDCLADVYRTKNGKLSKQYRKVAKLIREFKNKK